jgi:hypothetical protein
MTSESVAVVDICQDLGGMSDDTEKLGHASIPDRDPRARAAKTIGNLDPTVTVISFHQGIRNRTAFFV